MRVKLCLKKREHQFLGMKSNVFLKVIFMGMQLENVFKTMTNFWEWSEIGF